MVSQQIKNTSERAVYKIIEWKLFNMAYLLQTRLYGNNPTVYELNP